MLHIIIHICLMLGVQGRACACSMQERGPVSPQHGKKFYHKEYGQCALLFSMQDFCLQQTYSDSLSKCMPAFPLSHATALQHWLQHQAQGQHNKYASLLHEW